MGGMDTKGRFHVHWGPPETYGERREESALRRSGRTVPDQAYEHFAPFDMATVDEILDAHDHDPKHMLQILEAHPGGVRLPARRGAQAHQRAHRRVVRDDLRHRLVLRPPPVRAARREGAGRRRSRARRRLRRPATSRPSARRSPGAAEGDA